ncbi:protein DEHYDRATION-INDUCED 19 homolog 7-like isoform X1 [Coffea eugenioides]|uniref:protein DEHYDRATION-INDUCED 19 homolog 7-like isoform X1 n=1 Tax=Coffea eugenioides TaxID=49369 RepID=UPI000F60D127|nr:protein DEHYDRATION-INDUCED 19 homolog 7-like isoform X1 [Coffea eugenioides]
MADHDQDWEIGISTSSSSSKKGTAACLPPPEVINVGADSYIDVEEEEDAEEYDDDVDDDDTGSDEKLGLACPFCSEDFDVLELYCHVDVVHHKEARAQICPVCVSKVETNMAVHLITQHETILKILCKKKFRNGGSHPALSSLKKELWDEHLHSPPKGSRVSSSSAVESDSLLLPFLYNPQPEIVIPLIEGSSLGSDSPDSNLESSGNVNLSALPDKDEEKAQRCEFIRGLLVSTILGDQL